MNTAEQAVKRPTVNVTTEVEALHVDVVWSIAAHAVQRASAVRRKGNTLFFSSQRQSTELTFTENVV